MSVMRRNRLAGIAGVVAMVMAVLAVCPCPAIAVPSAEAGRSEGAHACCPGKAGLAVTAAEPSCCLEEASDPQLADTRIVPAQVADWAAIHALVSAAPPLPVLTHVTVAVPRFAAPPILRI